MGEENQLRWVGGFLHTSLLLLVVQPSGPFFARALTLFAYGQISLPLHLFDHFDGSDLFDLVSRVMASAIVFLYANSLGLVGG